MEGLADCEVFESPRKLSLREYLFSKLDNTAVLIPGLCLAALLAFVGTSLSGIIGKDLMGFEKSPISPILVSVIIGLLLRNLIGVPKAFENGLRFCIKQILRIGVALLGLRLSIIAVGQIGLQALPVVVCSIVVALVFVMWLSKVIGLPPRLGNLIAVGTAICGVSAIVATAPAIDAEDDEVSYAVAVITLFGLLALFAYPVLSHWIFSGDHQLAGFFLGSAIHDTSQVAGAGLMYQLRYDAPEGLNVATTTKLVRNLCMGAVIPFIAIWHHRRSSGAHLRKNRLPWNQWVPFFVVAFVALAAVRSLGDYAIMQFQWIEMSTWENLLRLSTRISLICLTVAMASIGLGTSLAQFKKLGLKPLAVGFAVAATVGVVSIGMIRLVNSFM